MLFERESGIVLHPTSLPSATGIGELGCEALEWVNTLVRMRQSLWQILPLGPTGYGDSPYQSPSTFAGNPLLVDLEDLVERGLLAEQELAGLAQLPRDRVSFEQVIPMKTSLLQKAAQAFQRRRDKHQWEQFEAFCERENWWLQDFAFFWAAKEVNTLRPWWEWPEHYRDPESTVPPQGDGTLAQLIMETKIVQFFFDLHWKRVREKANSHGIRVIGDVPIFVAQDSADVWAHRKLYQLDDEGMPTVVSGVPPDYFSPTGQRWGNPLYDWQAHQAEGFRWWVQRMRKALEMYDIVRIDHFRGFAAHWEIPADEPTATNGRWVNAPGRKLFEKFQAEFGTELPVMAEDLGILGDEVESLRDDFHLPGMRILQFAFGTDPNADTFHPNAYIRNCAAYSGSHDNDPIVGWFHDDGSASSRTPAECEQERELCRRELEIPGDEINWEFIEVLMGSRAGAAIFQFQDVLGLGSDTRMNKPGEPSGNWRWRFLPEQVTEEIVERMAAVTERFGRNLQVAPK